MRPVSAFWLIPGLSAVGSLMVLATPLLVVWRHLEPETRMALLQAGIEHLPWLVPAGVLALLGFFWGVFAVFNRYVRPSRHIAEQLGIIHAANPAHRIDPSTIKGCRALAVLINEIADRHQTLQMKVDELVRSAGQALEQDRNMLATIVSSFPEAVIVCSPTGTILLYNRMAEDLLGQAFTDTAAGNCGMDDADCTEDRRFLGLGKDLTAFFDRRQVREAFREIEETAGNVPVFLACSSPRGQRLEVTITPVLETPGKVAVLVVRFPPPLATPRSAATPLTLPDEVLIPYDFDLRHRPHSHPGILDQLLTNLSYTVIDTETTGLDPIADDIISIGAVRIVNGRLCPGENFHALIDPHRDIPERSVKYHGLRRDMLEGQPSIDQVLPLFARFAENTVLLGHNIAFDMRMFQVLEYKTPIRFTQPVLDIMFLSAVIHPTFRRHGLDAIAERMGVTVTGRHTALGDATTAANIFLKFLPILARLNILTLREAIEVSRKTSYAKLSY